MSLMSIAGCEILEIEKRKLAHLPYHSLPQMGTKHPHILNMFPYGSYKAV